MRKARPLIILFLIVGLPLLILFFLNSGDHKRKKIDVISPKIANPDGSPDSLYHTVSNFTVVNQSGDQVSSQDLEGTIIVASLFFTNCGNDCNKVNRAVRRAHDYPNFQPFPEIRYLSISVDPAADTVAALSQYAESAGADPGRWNFVTGNKSDLYKLIKQDLLLEADSSMNPTEIDHRIRLIDPEGRLRGQEYEGTSDADVKNLIDHIKLLQIEYAKDE